MKPLCRLTAVRLATSLFVCVATPIAGASTIATTQRELVALHASVSAPSLTAPTFSAPFLVGEPGAERERLQQVALLVSADSNDISRALLTRFPATSGASSRSDAEMGLQLPEPGPLSAIIATLALAGFVMVRRVV